MQGINIGKQIMDYAYVRFNRSPGDNYSIVNGLAYTEDLVLVYNISVYNIPKTTTEQQALDYFNKFGEVLKVRLALDPKENEIWQSPEVGFVNFANPKVAAKVLQHKNHILNECIIWVQARDSWHQPDAHTAESLHVAEQKADDDIKSAEAKPNTKTEQPSCSSSSSVDLDALILKLNDDCLEHICKNLVMRDKINFARACQRFRDVFIMLSKVEHKILLLNKMESLTLWQIREFLNMTGPHIESLMGNLPIFCAHNRIVEFLGLYCTNVKCVNINSTRLNPVLLRKLIGKMSLCTELKLKDVDLDDDSIPIIKSLPNLKILKLERNFQLTGKHISDLRGIEDLSLGGFNYIQSFHFQEICKNLTNLNTLDIRHCMELKSADFKQITKSLINLENLKFSIESELYECIAQLPKLKSLEIWDGYRSLPISHQLFVNLAKYKSEQLEELLLMSRNTLNLERAALVGELKKLKRLSCGSNETFDDKCLEKIAQLTELQEISVMDCNAVTNKGILNLLENCNKLNRLNIIGCNLRTVAFVFDALNLLKLQNVQKQRKGSVHVLADAFVFDALELLKERNVQMQHKGRSVHILANFINIDPIVAAGISDLNSSSNFMKFNFQSLFGYFQEYVYVADHPEFYDGDDLDMLVLHHAQADDVNGYVW